MAIVCKPIEEHERRFGIMSDEFPWGNQFWQGFRDLLIGHYFGGGGMKGSSWLDPRAAREAQFTVPLLFSKAAAQHPQSEGNHAGGSVCVARV